MKKMIVLAVCCSITAVVFCQPKNISIIPEPVQLVKTNGAYLLPKDIVIGAAKTTAVQFAADYLQKKINSFTPHI